MTFCNVQKWYARDGIEADSWNFVMYRNDVPEMELKQIAEIL